MTHSKEGTHGEHKKKSVRVGPGGHHHSDPGLLEPLRAAATDLEVGAILQSRVQGCAQVYREGHDSLDRDDQHE